MSHVPHPVLPKRPLLVALLPRVFPAYNYWIRQDKYLYIALLGSYDVFRSQPKTCLALRESLTTRKGSTNAASYLQTIRSIAEELTLICYPLDDFDLVIYALSGFDDSYREFTPSILIESDATF